MFGRDIKTIGKHINNALREELEGEVVVAKFATTTQHGAQPGKTQTHMTEYYSLDMVLSVGYCVKSKRGVEFRHWANKVLRQYILDGYAVNQKRLQALYKDGTKVISDGELTAMTLMIAESDPSEKEIMTTTVMNFLTI